MEAFASTPPWLDAPEQIQTVFHQLESLLWKSVLIIIQIATIVNNKIINKKLY